MERRNRPGDQAGGPFRDSLKGGSPAPEMIWIPSGSFRMGDLSGTGWTNEKPVQEVYVERFAAGVYPVTFADYDKFASATGRTKPYDNGWGRENRPVINVSWLDAMTYCKWLTEQTEHLYRLPTESEWEFAARGGTETDYWWGNELGRNRTNCIDSGSPWSNDKTSPVDAFEPNPYGLYDILGNVWEWTCSKYENEFNGEEQHYFDENLAKAHRAIRGGSWHDNAHKLRVSSRAGSRPDYRTYSRGFRLVSRKRAPSLKYPGWMP